ncbi:hypothetical protein SAMN05443637_116148 [Pseudonocardia thermophila]|jgi:hypothetical protein|uniref:Tetratricopeptide repeat-containing protein n=1 Tax=Pseudonocardia thermophila TaxID=1848 RepID=A0A1M6XBA1_PSETH|nr:hypothetical protein [Pseudonocardia thermophila]SHL03226.1 hypothetical protein SAMN05443637_116148 [Pseudonocardia thermophila]
MADEVIERITAVVQRGLDGERAAACEELETLWVEHTDPLHRCVIAHFLADLQDDVHAELLWDERALAAAGEIGDDQVREIAPGLQVRGFLPSLYGSVADDHRRLGDADRARGYLAEAQAATDALGDDPYGAHVTQLLDDIGRALAAGSTEPLA